MKFKKGDVVVFRGDPEPDVFRVDCAYGDCERVRLSDGEWAIVDGVPSRLLALAPLPVRVGDVYEEYDSGRRFYVVGVRSGGGFWVYDSRFEGPLALASYSEEALLEIPNCRRVVDGSE